MAVKYYMFPGESDLGPGTVYMEVDTQNDIVTRQAENYVGVWRFGLFDGEKLVGHIADTHASELSLRADEEIAQELFERVWMEARETESNSSRSN